MADIPHLWRTYARLQAEVHRNSRVTPLSWGAEAGLDRLLASVSDTSSVQEEIGRAMAGGARRERHRARLRAAHFAVRDGEDHDPENGLNARARLRAIESSLGDADWGLLSAVAMGTDYAELAGAGRGSEGALRVRVLRLRRQLAASGEAG